MKKKNINKTLIIAEIGPNHNGSLERAIKMVKQLAYLGADVVKFQITCVGLQQLMR